MAPRAALTPATMADVQRVEGRVDAHEKICAERMKRIDEHLERGHAERKAMGETMLSSLRRIYNLLWAAAGSFILILLGAIGYFLITHGLKGSGS